MYVPTTSHKDPILGRLLRLSLRAVSLSRSPGSKVGSPGSREGSPGSKGGMVASRVVDAFTGRGMEGAGWNALS